MRSLVKFAIFLVICSFIQVKSSFVDVPLLENGVNWLNVDELPNDDLAETDERSIAIGTILGWSWKALKAYHSLRQPTIKDVLEMMEEGFKQINQQLQAIEGALDQIMGMINQMEVQNAFRDDERYIMDSVLLYTKMMNMTTKAGHDMQRKQFVQVGYQLFNSVKHILEGLLDEGGIFSTDLLQKIVEFRECHARKIGEDTAQLMGLVNSGIYVLAAYDQITKTPAEVCDWNINFLENLYNRTYDRVVNQMASCRDETRVPGDMVTFMERNNYGSNQDMANHLRAFLDDKYDDKYWAVVVCAGKNYRASDYFLVGRGKKDAFAMSYTVNRTYTISQSAIDGINSLPQNDYDLNSGFNSVMNRVGWESIRLVTFGGNCDEGVDRNPSIQRTHSRQNTYCKRQWWCLWICETCSDTFKARAIPVP